MTQQIAAPPTQDRFMEYYPGHECMPMCSPPMHIGMSVDLSDRPKTADDWENNARLWRDFGLVIRGEPAQIPIPDWVQQRYGGKVRALYCHPVWPLGGDA